MARALRVPRREQPMTAGPRTPAYQVSRNAIGLWTVEGVLSAVFLMIAALLALLLVPGDVPTVLGWLVGALPWLIGVYAVVAIGVRPRFRYRVHHWEISDEAVYTLTGWLSQTWTIVPISRIQTVDVNRGVLQRLFGLASVAVLTASSKGTIEIVHLDDPVAGAVAADLARRAQAVRDEAT